MGSKVVQTFTGGPSKIFNPDGSTSYTTPPPTIHELYGGGFSYASGRVVSDRTHLEMITDLKMRERALQWFDGHGKVSQIATENVPPLDLDKKEEPEPVYVISTDMPIEKDEVTKDLNKTVQGAIQGVNVVIEKLNQDGLFATMEAIRKNVSAMMDTIKEQGNQISELKKSSPAPKILGKQSEIMKKKWADPEWRARREAKRNGKDVT